MYIYNHVYYVRTYILKWSITSFIFWSVLILLSEVILLESIWNLIKPGKGELSLLGFSALTLTFWLPRRVGWRWPSSPRTPPRQRRGPLPRSRCLPAVRRDRRDSRGGRPYKQTKRKWFRFWWIEKESMTFFKLRETLLI